MTNTHALDREEIWAIVESSPDGVILADEHGTILMVNAQIEVLFGYDRADLLGKPVEELVPERHRRTHTAHRTRYRAAPTTRAMGGSLTLHGSRKDGTEFPVEISLGTIPTNGPLRMVATVRDISDRVAADAHTHAVVDALDATPDAVFMFPADTLTFSYVNRGAVAQLGYTADELTTMTPLHITPDVTERTFRLLIESLRDGAADTHLYTTVHRRKDGSDTPVEISLKYSRSSQAHHRDVIVAVARDISDRLRTEEALGEQRAQTRVIEERDRLARDLHDTVIQRLFATGMGLQSVRSRITDADAVARVDHTMNELDETILDLRSAIFRLTGPITIAIDTQLRQTIERCTSGLGFAPSVTFVGDPEIIPTAVVDQLLPTLTEALANVVRHAHATDVRVDLTITDSALELVISDNGIGLPPRPRTGNGLNNIGSRARLLDGEFVVTPGQDRGTSLRWTARFDGQR